MAIPNEWLKFAPAPRSLTAGDEWHVFLSYRSVNRRWVVNLYDVLVSLGFKVFLDQTVLKPGDQLVGRLQTALSKSQAGILIWTNDTRDSTWVEREYQVLETQATGKPGFQFVPLKLDGSALPPFAAIRIFLDFSSYPDGPNGGELLRLLHGIVGKALSPEAAVFALQQDESARKASEKIGAAIRNKNPQQLVQLFAEDGLPWRTASALGCKAAEGLTRLGANNDAIAMLEQLSQQFPAAIRPVQLRALALARRGSDGDLARAQELLGELVERGQRDPETLGIYGRTWMDRYEKSKDPQELRQSRDYYADAFRRAPDDYYTGINAAAKSVLLGTPEDLAKAAEYAKQVQVIVGTSPDPDASEPYWRTATAAEACLIQKDYTKAAELYVSAVAMAPAETGSHASTRKQAARLLTALRAGDDDRARILGAFAHLPDEQSPPAKGPTIGP